MVCECRDSKILVTGSASALRGMKRASTYSAARGAQLAYVQAARATGVAVQARVSRTGASCAAISLEP
jgi:hypothetical protein